MLINVVYGFLGAGKTTFIQHLMEHPPEGEKVVILVNEFGEVGIDGLILASQGDPPAEVVELPSGCICCTMAWDFRRQVLDLHERYAPDRMIVEPTGVATISQVMQILEGEDLRKLYDGLSLIHILDGSEFLSFIKSHRMFVENQIRRSGAVILNKIDRIKPTLVSLLVESVKEINPSVSVYPSSFGKIDRTTLNQLLRIKISPAPSPAWAGDTPSEIESLRDHDRDREAFEDRGFADEFESFGRKFPQRFDRQQLALFFERLNSGVYGEVIRAKGVFKTPEGMVKIELASGEAHTDPGPAAQESVVSIIGRRLDISRIQLDLTRCFAQ